MRLAWVSTTTIALSVASLSIAGEADASIKRFTSIPAQQLETALQTLAKEGDFQILYRSEIVRSLQSAGAVGDLTQDEALQRVLSGTGLTYRHLDEKAVTIEQAEPSATLPAAASATASSSEAATVDSSSATNSGASAAPLDEVVVTGTRVLRDGYEAPTPTSVMSAEEIANVAPQNIADLVNRLPQLAGSTTPRSAGNGVAGGVGGANFLNTRSLGIGRTLTLLNSRRVVASALTGAVDVNLLPQNLVERVEVVTGGASAAYGSDAVAGVVNFILDSDYTGLKGSVAMGGSTHGDADQWSANFAFGDQFADGRGHVLLSGQYTDTEGVLRADSRDWYKGYKQIRNPAYTATNGEPANLVLPGVGLARATDGGVIVSGPLRGTAFGPNGELQAFTFGGIQDGLIAQGGTANDVGGRFALLPPLEQYTGFARVSFDLTERTVAYTELSYGYSDAANTTSPFVRHGDISISSDNPFIPSGLNMAGVTSFSMGRTNYDLGVPEGHNVRRLYRAVVGVDGGFGDSVAWNFYYQYGKSKILNEVPNNPIRANYNQAVDVVRNPATGGVAGVATGAPVCRSTLTSPGNGCQPMNIFGFGAPSAESIAYVNGVARQDIDIRQDVVALSAQVEPFSTWAGVVSVAAGAEYREESYVSTADELSVSTSYWLGNFKPGEGEYNVKEAFVETIVPLLNDAPLADSLELNLAARFTDYSTSGEVETWKAGITYDINSEIRLRATRSRDIRAPNLGEMFLGGQVASVGVQDVLQPSAPNVFALQRTGGNPALMPETADTNALGIVYRPSWLPGFSASIDYYDISIDGAIIAMTARDIINQCYGFGVPAVPGACSAITLAIPGTLERATINVGGVNAQTLETSGFDIEMGYRMNLGSGALSLRAMATNVREYEQLLGNVVTDNLNAIGGTNTHAVKWRGLLSADFDIDWSRTSLAARYIGSLVYNNWPDGNPLSVDRNRIASRTYLDLSQTFVFPYHGVGLELFGVVENLLDDDPSIVASSGGNNYAGIGTDGSVFDTLGRTYRVGVRFSF